MTDHQLLRQLSSSRSLSPEERRAVLRAAAVLEDLEQSARAEDDTRPIAVPASVRLADRGHR